MGRATLLVDPGIPRPAPRGLRFADQRLPAAERPMHAALCAGGYVALARSFSTRYVAEFLAARLGGRAIRSSVRRQSISRRREENEDQGPEIRLVAEGVKTP